MPRFAHNEIGWAPVATPTDILTLRGTANSMVYLRRFRLVGLATTAGFIPVNLLKRTTANAGGASTTPTPAKRNKEFANSAAELRRYTANPTGLGTAGDIQFNERLFMNLVGSFHDRIDLEWEKYAAPALEGLTDFLALNLAGATLPAGSALDLLLEWDEE